MGCSKVVQAKLQQKTESGHAPAAWLARPDAPLSGALTGPLAGLRFAAKDNIDVAGLATPKPMRPWSSACSTLVHRWPARPTSISSPAA
jgi:Asp-tRNA(Asn)/Glu-tRNA(Gln) amidotransferase A subunit family amidase